MPRGSFCSCFACLLYGSFLAIICFSHYYKSLVILDTFATTKSSLCCAYWILKSVPYSLNVKCPASTQTKPINALTIVKMGFFQGNYEVLISKLSLLEYSINFCCIVKPNLTLLLYKCTLVFRFQIRLIRSLSPWSDSLNHFRKLLAETNSLKSSLNQAFLPILLTPVTRALCALLSIISPQRWSLIHKQLHAYILHEELLYFNTLLMHALKTKFFDC